MMRLKYCNYVNGLPEWVGKYSNTEIVLCKPYFGVIGHLNCAKRAKNTAKRGAKIQKGNFEAHDAFEVL